MELGYGVWRTDPALVRAWNASGITHPMPVMLESLGEVFARGWYAREELLLLEEIRKESVKAAAVDQTSEIG